MKENTTTLEELFALDKNSDFREFFKFASSTATAKKSFDITTTFRIKVQNIAIANLGLRDIFQLRDRFEGQAYMDNLLLKVSSLHILEKLFSVKLIDWDLLRSSKTIDITLIEIQNKEYRVIPFYDGTLPIVSTSVCLPIIFCAVKKDYKLGTVYGILENYSFDDQSAFMAYSNSFKSKLRKFIGFYSLKDV